MRDLIEQLIPQIFSSPKLAATVGGTTAVTSTFDLIQGGVSLLAITVGALLSISLIVIHWKRWLKDEREAKIRLDMDIKANKKELEHMTLENRKLKIELNEKEKKKKKN